MSLDPQQQQFANSVPATPLIDDAMKKLGQGIDAFMNGLIEKVGGALDTATAAVKDLGKAPLVSMGKSLEGDIALMPPSTPLKNNEPSEKGQSQQIELSRVPELQIAMEKSGPSNLAQGLKCEHCNMQDSGLLASPYTPSLGTNRNQSIGIG
jgi:hypothetical protein